MEMIKVTKREFLSGMAASLAAGKLAQAAHAMPAFDPRPDGWKRYEVTTTMKLATPDHLAQVWVPLPSLTTSWTKPLGNDWQGQGVTAREVDVGGAKMLHAVWEKGATPAITVRSRFATQNRWVNWNAPHAPEQLPAATREEFLAPTAYIPVTGQIKTLSGQITKGITGDREKVAAIYNWVVCNTYRDGKVKGCGTGNVAAMLKLADFGGKCADLNGLFAGLVRSAGIPARDIYGVRVAPSAFGYHSLGANSPNITKAQHCRSDVYLAEYGWVAMDPADVRKVMLEEVKGGLPLSNPRVAAARQTLFGGWEGNWMPYNDVNDIVLPGGGGRRVSFLMYPQAQVDGVWLDPLAPKTVEYQITAKPV